VSGHVLDEPHEGVSRRIVALPTVLVVTMSGGLS